MRSKISVGRYDWCFSSGSIHIWWNKIPSDIADALKLYGNRLTEFEKNEIEKYSKIWYLGLNACKIHGEPGGSQNCGYDDESGSYIKVRH
jgi:dual specificity tyrosine-phosphorylation-regulated kinase 2/3/4